MKLILTIVIFSLAFSACKKDNIVLNADYIGSIEPCFSEIKLRDHEIIIQTNAEYTLFEDSIRRNFSPSCADQNLPEINFDTHFFIGKYVGIAGCSIDINREIIFDPNSEQYIYTIQYLSDGLCEIYFTDMNWAIVPIQKKDAPIIFNVSVQ